SRKRAHISSMGEYRQLYQKSVTNPEEFWTQIAKEFFWNRWPTDMEFVSYNFDVRKGPVAVKWLDGCQTNVCYNVLDRLIIDKGLGDRVAFHWQSNDDKCSKSVTYSDLLRDVCRFANVMKGLNVKRGDRVAIYMSVTVEVVVVMLACARIGAVHSFAGFSAEALADRIIDANCVLLVTTDGAYRANKFVPLKSIADSALDICKQLNHKVMACIVNPHLNLHRINISKGNTDNGDHNDNTSINWYQNMDILWTDAMNKVTDYCEPEWMDSEDPLFILYTSGSTGKPKGIVHTSAGYLLYTYISYKHAFNYRDGDVFMSTSDLGWLAGHTFSVYGPLANGGTVVMLEGTPYWPTPDRLWRLVDQLAVNMLYTTPTIIRQLMTYGEQRVRNYSRRSLKVLAVVGEPMNPDAWRWVWDVVGERRCSVVDTYGQTETGAMITGLAGCTPMKPGSAGLPLFGAVPAILDAEGRELDGPAVGQLVFKKPWPGIARTIAGNHGWFEMTYFNKFKGYYWTGDGARRDADGYYYMTGRTDDTLKVSGRLLSTVEIEAAVVGHRAVAEAAAVSAPHFIKGHCIHVFVVLCNGFVLTPDLVVEIKSRVRAKIGAPAEPEAIYAVSALPKTKTGKIMRRILTKAMSNDRLLGDTSAMADESVLSELFAITTGEILNVYPFND
ncbi:unnamed protein product, partial [Medioppia subpectinata]